jgi:hypothetical protein
MQHDDGRGGGEDRHQGREIGERQRIDEPGIPASHGHLDEGQAFRIVMQAVAFGVQRDLRDVAQPSREPLELGLGPDPG